MQKSDSEVHNIIHLCADVYAGVELAWMTKRFGTILFTELIIMTEQRRVVGVQQLKT